MVSPNKTVSEVLAVLPDRRCCDGGSCQHSCVGTDSRVGTHHWLRCERGVVFGCGVAVLSQIGDLLGLL